MQGFWTKVFSLNNLYYFGAILILVHLVFSLNSSLEKLNHLKSTKEKLLEKNKRLLEDIERLKKEIEEIKNKPDYLIDLAKKEFFYLKPEEYLYVFISKERINAQTFQKKKGHSNGSSGGIKK